MRIHREGTASLFFLLIVLFVTGWFVAYLFPVGLYVLFAIGLILFIFLLQFFRNPIRKIPDVDDNKIYAPADGKVVVIEKIYEAEYFKEDRLQVSIFMSPLNVHVNRCAMAGKVDYYKYHPGKYLVAWHPKSSTENERTTTVINGKNGSVLFRQIAGALARRIVNYLKAGDIVSQGEEMGFIKLGSRMDIFLPLDANVEVSIDQMVKGNLDVIATFK